MIENIWGERFPEGSNITSKEALIARRMNFKVNGTPVDTKIKLYRTDTKQMLGLVNKSYRIVDNDEVFAILDPVGNVKYTGNICYAWSRDGGGKCGMVSHTLRNDCFDLDFYIEVIIHHNGKGGITVTPQCVINGDLLMPNVVSKGYKISHAQNFNDRLYDLDLAALVEYHYEVTLSKIHYLYGNSISDRALDTLALNILNSSYLFGGNVERHANAIVELRASKYPNLRDHWLGALVASIDYWGNEYEFKSVEGMVQHHTSTVGKAHKFVAELLAAGASVDE